MSRPIPVPLPALRAWLTQTKRVVTMLERILEPEADGGETLDAWVGRWFARRATANLDDERSIYRRLVGETLGARSVSSLTREDAEAIVEDLDEQVRDGAIRPKTAARAWAFLRVVFDDQARTKVRALRVRTDSIVTGVRPPDPGQERAGTFLYPSEFLALVGCERVPIDERRIYALAVYLYPRAGELAALTWDDVDIETGRVHVFRSIDRDTGDVGSTKTATDRQFVAEREALRLLRAMRRRASGDEPIVARWRRRGAAKRLRRHLRWAGCTRADLHADDELRRPLTFHDLRATGITWQAMRGDSVADIVERVGHAQIATTQRYMRRGRLMATASGEVVFPRLPKELLRARRS